MKIALVFSKKSYFRFVSRLALEILDHDKNFCLEILEDIPEKKFMIPSRFQIHRKVWELRSLNRFLHIRIREFLNPHEKQRNNLLQVKYKKLADTIDKFDTIILVDFRDIFEDKESLFRKCDQLVQFSFQSIYIGLQEIVERADFVNFDMNVYSDGDIVANRAYFLPNQAIKSRNLKMIFFRLMESLEGIFLEENETQSLSLKIMSNDLKCSGLQRNNFVSNGFIIQFIRYYSVLCEELFSHLAKRVSIQSPRKWHVGYLNCDWESLQINKLNILPNPERGFYADPFLIQTEPDLYIICEEFDNVQKKGIISIIRLDETKTEYHRGVINEDFHLSFPFPFYFEGNLYVCPESGESREMRIYTCRNFPRDWELITKIDLGVSLLDICIFPHDGIWWLIGTKANYEIRDSYSEVLVYFSANPIIGNWQPHSMNPILIDSRKGRNAGFITDSSKLYRVAQNYGFRNYGKSFSIFEVVDLSVSSYQEIYVSDSSKMAKADERYQSHHLHATRGFSVIDLKI